MLCAGQIDNALEAWQAPVLKLMTVVMLHHNWARYGGSL